MKKPESPRWQRKRPLRPEPYLNWEALNRRSTAERWCPALVEIITDDRAQAIERLGEFASPAAARHGLLSADERDEVEEARRRLAAGHTVQPDDLIFGVALPERALFDRGQLVEPPGMRILHLGAPIAVHPGRDVAALAQPPIAGSRPAGGEVAIGILDDGIAFAHPRFRHADGTTRIKALWVQSLGDAIPDIGLGHGRRIYAPEIDAAIASGASEREIYRRFGRLDFTVPGHKSLALRWSHGAHVLDTASGADPVADSPARPIFAVDLPPEATADTSGQTMGTYVLHGVRQIMRWADRYRAGIPLVINFSYGIFAGPKDGSHPIERTLARLIAARNRRGAPTFLVLPAGNSFRSDTTARITIAGGARETIDWVMRPDDRTPSHLELWIEAPEGGPGVAPPVQWPSLHLQPTDGLPGMDVVLRPGVSHVLSAGVAPIAVVHASLWTGGGQARLRVVISAAPTVRREWAGAIAPSGRWTVGLSRPAAGTAGAVVVRAYVQRDDTPSGYRLRGRQSVLAHPLAGGRDPATGRYDRPQPGCPLTSTDTLSAIATHPGPITVGAATGATASEPSGYASSGPTLTGRIPDCSAVADRSIARPGQIAAGVLGGSHVTLSGTSIAAPQIARAIADALAEPAETGLVLRPGLTISAARVAEVSEAFRAQLGVAVIS